MRNNRFRRLTALILGVVMLLSLLPVTAITAHADTGEITVKSIVYAGEQPLQLTEGADISRSISRDESDETKDSIVVAFDPDDRNSAFSDLQYTVTYVDLLDGNKEKTETLWGYEIARRLGQYDGLLTTANDHNKDSSGNYTRWEAGETHNATVSAGGASCTVQIKIIENPYESLRYQGGDTIPIVLGEDDFTDAEGNWHWYTNARFAANLANGDTITGTLSEIESKTGARITICCSRNDSDLQVGHTYPVWLGFNGVGWSGYISITENSSFESITCNGATVSDPVQLSTNVWDSDDNGYCSLMLLDDLTYTVKLSETGMAKFGMDTDTFTGTWDTINETFGPFGFGLEETSDQNEQSWDADSTTLHYITVKLGSVSCDVPVVVVPSPYVDLPEQNFTSIALANPDEIFELTEGIDASFCVDGTFYYNPLDMYNPEVTVELTEEAQQYYGLTEQTLSMSWAELTGRFYDAYATSSNPEPTDVDGVYVCSMTIQNGTGSDSALTLPVCVKLVPETRIQSVEFLGDQVELVTNMDGYTDDSEGSSFFVYSLSNALTDGRAKFRVTLQDDSTIEGSGTAIYEQLGYFGINPLEDESAQDEQYGTPWTVGETDHSITVYFGSASCDVPVTLSDPWIEKIELANCKYLTDYYGAYNNMFGSDVQLTLTLSAAGQKKFGKNTMTGTVAELQRAMGSIWFSECRNYSYSEVEVGEEYEVMVTMGGCTTTLPAKIMESTPVNLNTIPDETFRQYLADRFSADEEGYIIAEAVNEIDCARSGIESLSGIERFPMLTYLDCTDNLLTELDVSKNAKLESLYCGYNKLSALDVSKNDQLIELDCSVNRLNSLDVTENSKLIELNCSNNQLTSLNVNSNTALESLYCGYNKLSALDVSNNAKLMQLACYENQLTSLNVSKNSKLIELDCESNRLTSLDVTTNTALKLLYCNDNNLSALNVSSNTELKYLSCYSNQLTNLNVTTNTALELLYCSDNKLSALDVSNNAELKYLYCGDNSLSALDVSRCPELLELECANNKGPLEVNVASREKLNLSAVGTDLILKVNSEKAAGADISGKVKSTDIIAVEVILTNSDGVQCAATYAAPTGKYVLNAVPDGKYTLKVIKWSENDAVPYTCEVTVASGKITGLPETIQLVNRGDVNLDGAIDVYDLQRLYEHVSGISSLTGYALDVANVNQEGNTDILDIQALYDALSGKSGINSAKTG